MTKNQCTTERVEFDQKQNGEGSSEEEEEEEEEE